jgi:hypothetical protein
MKRRGRRRRRRRNNNLNSMPKEGYLWYWYRFVMNLHRTSPRTANPAIAHHQEKQPSRT